MELLLPVLEAGEEALVGSPRTQEQLRKGIQGLGDPDRTEEMVVVVVQNPSLRMEEEVLQDSG